MENNCLMHMHDLIQAMCHVEIGGWPGYTAS